ncbi:MAG: hypothetical protein IKX68_07665 [Clostridiales bacterium]|nr:hypothetical protein [Clostridiales bacterium]
MKSKGFNTEITLTKADAETITNKLVAAGIDRKLVARVIDERVFGGKGCDKTENCVHCVKGKNPCTKYFRSAGPTDIAELKKQILERNIDIKSIHPKAETLFRD